MICDHNIFLYYDFWKINIYQGLMIIYNQKKHLQ